MDTRMYVWVGAKARIQGLTRCMQIIGLLDMDIVDYSNFNEM